MTNYADKRLQYTEHRLYDEQTARAYFDAADAANHAGNTEKATRYLRMAFDTTHNNQLLNQHNLKQPGETNNA